VPYRIVRPSNLYGLRQYPEKLIPKAVRHLVLGRPIPIHEGGNARRSWLQVEDGAQAILRVLEAGVNGETYNVGGDTEASVKEVATAIVRAFHGPQAHPADYLDLGYTRLGLDSRYHVEDTKLRALGWAPHGNLWADLPSLVARERKSFRW
jgi:dTDP-D-glucose 4,6-dehydratase